MFKFKNISLGISIVIVLVLGSELLLGLYKHNMRPSPFSWFHGVALYPIDDLLMYRNYPNASFSQINTYTNELGMKIPDNSKKWKALQTPAVVVLGDSFVWGDTIESETYPRQLQRLLDESLSPLHVYNAGTSGYGTDQEYAYFIQYVLPNLRPRIVIWNIHTNDVEDNKTIPLFDYRDNSLVPIPIWTNGIYLTEKLSTILPSNLMSKSHVLNALLVSLSRLRLYSTDTSKEKIGNLSKIQYEIDHMEKLSKQYKFTVFIALNPQQCIVENLDCANAQRQEVQALKDLIQFKERSIDQSDYFLSASSSSSLFLTEPDKFEKGWWHPNAKGNLLMAQSVLEAIKRYDPELLTATQ